MNILTKVSVEEYLIQEQNAEYKSEYHDGKVVAMAGASRIHNIIVSNLLFLLKRCFWDTDCQVYPSDMLLHLDKCKRYVYPDVMIVCENEQTEKHQGLDVLLNPKIIIEVFSESTSSYDLNEKMKCYLELSSLEEYIMVDSESLSVFSYSRNNEYDWLFKIFSKTNEIVRVGDCELNLGDIYKNVTFS